MSKYNINLGPRCTKQIKMHPTQLWSRECGKAAKQIIDGKPRCTAHAKKERK